MTPDAIAIASLLRDMRARGYNPDRVALALVQHAESATKPWYATESRHLYRALLLSDHPAIRRTIADLLELWVAELGRDPVAHDLGHLALVARGELMCGSCGEVLAGLLEVPA